MESTVLCTSSKSRFIAGQNRSCADFPRRWYETMALTMPREEESRKREIVWSSGSTSSSIQTQSAISNTLQNVHVSSKSGGCLQSQTRQITAALLADALFRATLAFMRSMAYGKSVRMTLSAPSMHAAIPTTPQPAPSSKTLHPLIYR